MSTPEEHIPALRPRAGRMVGVRVLIVCLALAGLIVAATHVHRLVQERNQLQEQLLAQERATFEIRERLTRAEVTLQEKEAALASRELALADATQPELPVRVAFRPAWMGQGMVATFRNVGPRELNLMVEFRDSEARATRKFALVVAPGATSEIGHAQGWLVSSGQSVHVGASGYRSVTAFAP